MTPPSAPLPPRQSGLTRTVVPRPLDRRRQSMTTTIVFFIVGLSVVLSYDWTNGGFRPDAPMTILFAILVAAIIYVASRFTMAARSPPGLASLPRICPSCGRSIPGDSVLCPYCGLRLS